MQQVRLFDESLRRPKSHHATKLNPDAIIANRVMTQVAREGKNGAMKDEVAVVLHLTPAQVSWALGELHKQGNIRRTEARRQTARKGWATVWVAVRRS
jgi:hypothetical protein